MANPQPGWYEDSQVPGGRRWWDGQRWTDHRQGPQGQQQPSAPHSPYLARPGYGAYQGRPYGPPPRRRSGASTVVVVILVIAGVAMLVIGAAVAFTVSTLSDVADGSGDGSTPSVSASAEAEVYSIGDRPGFDEMRQHIADMKNKYQQALSDDSIYDYVDRTDEGYAYAQAFVYVLIDLHNANTWNVVSTVPGELDAQIEARRNTADEYERRFLAGEDLGVSISITMSDGTTFQSDGVAPELVYDDPEEFAQNFTPQPDADGSYLAAAEELAAAFGMQLTFEYDDYLDSCSPNSHQVEDIGAVFCSGTPELIYVNPDYQNYPDELQWSTFVDMIRHEISHRRIFDHCGTAFPPISGAITEGVTNSYAVLYMGADEEDLGSLDSSYAMTDETFEIAEAIYSGSCG